MCLAISVIISYKHIKNILKAIGTLTVLEAKRFYLRTLKATKLDVRGESSIRILYAS
jgi:hypothetical protein